MSQPQGSKASSNPQDEPGSCLQAPLKPSNALKDELQMQTVQLRIISSFFNSAFLSCLRCIYRRKVHVTKRSCEVPGPEIKSLILAHTSSHFYPGR